jgi:hypothetical protein
MASPGLDHQCASGESLYINRDMYTELCCVDNYLEEVSHLKYSANYTYHLF